MKVEHEADERPLEARPRAHVNGEACAAEFGSAFEVQYAESFAEFPVGLGGEVPGALGGIGQMSLDDDVVGFGCAGWNLVAGEVRNQSPGRQKLPVFLGRDCGKPVHLPLQDRRSFQQIRNARSATLSLRDFLAQRIDISKPLSRFRNGVSSLPIKRLKAIQSLLGGAVGSQLGRYDSPILYEELRIMHRSFSLTDRFGELRFERREPRAIA